MTAEERYAEAMFEIERTPTKEIKFIDTGTMITAYEMIDLNAMERRMVRAKLNYHDDKLRELDNAR